MNHPRPHLRVWRPAPGGDEFRDRLQQLNDCAVCGRVVPKAWRDGLVAPRRSAARRPVRPPVDTPVPRRDTTD